MGPVPPIGSSAMTSTPATTTAGIASDAPSEAIGLLAAG